MRAALRSRGSAGSAWGLIPPEMGFPPLNFPAKFLIYPPGKAYLGNALRGLLRNIT